MLSIEISHLLEGRKKYISQFQATKFHWNEFTWSCHASDGSITPVESSPSNDTCQIEKLKLGPHD